LEVTIMMHFRTEQEAHEYAASQIRRAKLQTEAEGTGKPKTQRVELTETKGEGQSIREIEAEIDRLLNEIVESNHDWSGFLSAYARRSRY
jgi:3-dehydroquinate dehydratase